MRDQKTLALALTHLDALRKNIPDRITEDRVVEYHGILEQLQNSSGEDLSSFRVDSKDVQPRVVSFRLGSRRSPGSTSYSTTKYCDDDLFKRKVESLWAYVQQLKPHEISDPKDYWSMSDEQLEQLGIKYHLHPISMIQSTGEWYVDRDRVIAELVKRDKALTAGQPPSPPQQIHIGTMSHSTIQQGGDNLSANVRYNINLSEATTLVQSMRDALTKIELSPIAKSQVEADINTISAQLDSPHPKPSIITECFQSAKAIFEGTLGNLIAMGIAQEIARHLGK